MQRLPRFGEPARVAFVGQETYFAQCATHAETRELRPRFFDFRAGVGHDAEALRAALDAWGAHVVVVFRPEIIPPGAFRDLRALTLGFVTEPLKRAGAEEHPDHAYRESELAQTDAANFDRVVAFDPHVAATADRHAKVWRSLPLPVDDRLYAPVRPSATPPRSIFVGYSTEHRERFLINAKHEYDVLHYAHGLHGDELREVFGRVDIALNIHGEPYPSFENRVLLHLAAGHLVISEPLDPTHGLEAGIDFLEIRRPDELMTLLYQLHRRPETFERVRHRGRAKADDYRASRVWPRVIGDLLADVRAFGSERASAATR
ncbi:MAG TPA: hypothetical protein VIL49_14960 [Capillimicrobium sp.]|jgi:hypothetical protein